MHDFTFFGEDPDAPHVQLARFLRGGLARASIPVAAELEWLIEDEAETICDAIPAAFHSPTERERLIDVVVLALDLLSSVVPASLPPQTIVDHQAFANVLGEVTRLVLGVLPDLPGTEADGHVVLGTA